MKQCLEEEAVILEQQAQDIPGYQHPICLHSKISQSP